MVKVIKVRIILNFKVRNIKQMEEERGNRGTPQNIASNTPRQRWNFYCAGIIKWECVFVAVDPLHKSVNV